MKVRATLLHHNIEFKKYLYYTNNRNKILDFIWRISLDFDQINNNFISKANKIIKWNERKIKRYDEKEIKTNKMNYKNWTLSIFIKSKE